MDLCKFQANQVYIVRPCLKHETKVSCPIYVSSGSLQTLCLPKDRDSRLGPCKLTVHQDFLGAGLQSVSPPLTDLRGPKNCSGPVPGGHFLCPCGAPGATPAWPTQARVALLPAPGLRPLLTTASPYFRALGPAMPPAQTFLRTFPGHRSAADPAGARATQAASAGPGPAGDAPPRVNPHARGLHPAQNSTQNLGVGGGRGLLMGETRERENLAPQQASRPLGGRRPAATAKRFQILAGRPANRGRD